MSAITTMTIADATPTDHDFSPVSVGLGNTLLINREALTAAGQMKVMLGLDLASPKRATNRVDVRFDHPFESTVEGVTSVTKTARFFGQWVLPQDLTVAEQLRFATMVKSLVNDARVAEYVEGLDPSY